jgi:hypothetical protein
MFQVLPDSRLFRFSADANVGSSVVLSEEAHEAIDAGSMAMLNAEIARIASDIYFRMVRMSRGEYKKVALADYLTRQKVTVPIAPRYMTLVAGPIHKSDVEDCLRKWGFDPTAINVYMKKRRMLRSRLCVFEITFVRK